MNAESKVRAAPGEFSSISLLPARPASWAHFPFEKLLQVPRKEREDLQLAALQYRFEQMKDGVSALERLARQQGVKRIDRLGDSLPLFFDHRVLKNYPASLIEDKDFSKLTAWLDRMTLHDLKRVDLSGLTTIDSWLDRLDDYGMLIGHSTGTTGKLSFVPRSVVEYPAWKASFYDTYRAATGVDYSKELIPTFFPGYRGGHQMAQKMMNLFNLPASGGPEHYHTLYQTKLSADLMSLAGRLQSAEDRGELNKLGLDPSLLKQREEMIAQGRRREEDVAAWFTKMIEDFRGKRVKIIGPSGDLLRTALMGNAKGLKCAFGAGSIIQSGGGLKGFKDPPADWPDVIKQFFGIDRICSVYGMSECTGQAPLCSHGFHHLMPYMIPVILDRDAKELPREGVQTGRMALFDLLAETYWGGFISGDQVTMHWDEDCPCGWKGPRITTNITRFAEMEGGDEKITCAGSTQAYNEFMDYVMQV